MNDECERCLRWIKDSIAGELSPGDRSRMEAHLASCPACAHESRLLERVAAHLCDLSEEPVPRHFLVYEDEHPSSAFGRAFQALGWGWKISLAGVASVLLIGCALVVAQARLEVAPGRFVLTFGSGSGQSPALEASPELMQAVRAVVQEENGKWADAVRQELSGSLAQVTDDNRRADRDMLVALELRLDQKLAAHDDETRQVLQATLSQWGRALAMQRQDDLAQIRQAFLRVSANDQLQVGQANAILSTLARITNSRNPQGDSR
ncbi:MAG: zf-HC2 domain-containing protein [Acidobacteriota bacterium]